MLDDTNEVIRQVVEKLTSRDTAILCAIGTGVVGICWLVREGIKVLG